MNKKEIYLKSFIAVVAIIAVILANQTRHSFSIKELAGCDLYVTNKHCSSYFHDSFKIDNEVIYQEILTICEKAKKFTKKPKTEDTLSILLGPQPPYIIFKNDRIGYRITVDIEQYMFPSLVALASEGEHFITVQKLIRDDYPPYAYEIVWTEPFTLQEDDYDRLCTLIFNYQGK